jgi:hypothetical protein
MLERSNYQSALSVVEHMTLFHAGWGSEEGSRFSLGHARLGLLLRRGYY